MKTCGLRLVLAALLAVSLAGCGGEEMGADIETEATAGKSDAEKLLEGLGINTDWTPQRDASGKALPDGWNPLGVTGAAGARKAVDPKHEIFRVFVDTGTFNTLYADSAEEDVHWLEQLARDMGLPGFADPNGYDDFADPDTWNGTISTQYIDYALGIVNTTLGSSVIYHNFDTGWPESDEDLVEIKRDSSENAWLKVPKKAIAADFDGDGYDEVLIAVAYFEAGQIGIRLGRKSSSTGFSSDVLRIDYGDGLSKALPWHNGMRVPGADHGFIQLFVQNEFQYYCLDLAAGDIDFDGKMEALLVVGNTVYLLDSGEDGTAWTAENLHYLDLPDYSAISVAFADYNNDGYDDWVEASASIHDGTKNATYNIYDGKTREALGTLNSFGDIAPVGTTHMLSSANIVTGDFDGDGVPETAFCGREFVTHEYMLYILDTWLDASGNPQFGFWDAVNANESRFPFPPGTISYKGTDTPGLGDPPIGSAVPAMVAGDFNGDGVDELFAVGEIFGLDADGVFGSLWKQDTGNNTYYDLAACGDINADGLPDIVYLDWRSRLVCVNFNDGTYARTNISYYNFMIPPYMGMNYYPALALANINDDSYIVEYEGQQMTFTQPLPVAVIASPPYYAGGNTPQNQNSFCTTYGSISAGLELTADMNIRLRLEGETSAEIDGSCLLEVLGAVNITRAAVECSVTAYIQTPFGEDTVVFTAVPYYVHKYKVLNSPADNRDAGGKKLPAGGVLIFNYPGEMGIYANSMDFYNSHNGSNPAVKIPSVIGQPFTYPTRAGLETIAADNPDKVFLDSNAVYTTRSDNSSHVSEAVVSRGWTLDSTVSSKDEYGVSVSRSMKTKIPDGFHISTRVPDLPSSSSLAPFNWSLAMYPIPLDAVTTGTSITFNYMSYAVDSGY